jgi:hypothetical protein
MLGARQNAGRNPEQGMFAQAGIGDHGRLAGAPLLPDRQIFGDIDR